MAGVTVRPSYGGPDPFGVPDPGKTTYRSVNPVRTAAHYVLNGRNPIAAFCNTAFANCGSQLSGRVPVGISANEGRFRELAKVYDRPGSYTDLRKRQDSTDAAMIRDDPRRNKFEWLAGRQIAESQKKAMHDSERHLESATSAVMNAAGGDLAMMMDTDDRQKGIKGNGAKSEKEMELDQILGGGCSGAGGGYGKRASSASSFGQPSAYGDRGLASRLAQDLHVMHGDEYRGDGGGGGASAKGLSLPPMKRRRGDVARSLPRSRGRFARIS